MFFTRLGRAWLICRNNVLHHIRFFIICSVSQVFQVDFCSFTLQTYLYDITLFLKMQLSLLSEKMFFLLKQNISPVVSFLRIVLRCPERKYLFTIFVISQSFLFSCMFLRVLGKHFLLRLSTVFYHFLNFRESTFASTHN